MTDRQEDDVLAHLPAGRKKLIERIAAHARRLRHPRLKLPDIDRGDFIRRYYRGVDEDDLRRYDTTMLAHAALAHLEFAAKRRPGATLIRIYNPDAGRGWTSPHSVLDVVGADMPFLVDSISMALARAGMGMHLLVHPIFGCRRDRAGRLIEIGTGNTRESWQHIQIDRLTDPAAIAALERQIAGALRDVRLACKDWQTMHAQALAAAAALQAQPRSLTRKEVVEARAFVTWLANNHFTFLGTQELRLRRHRSHDMLEPITGSALGILRHGGGERLKPLAVRGTLRRRLREPEPILITKSTSRSTVHRAGHLDQISIKRFDARGRVIGGLRILGLFTSTAYQASALEVPWLRRKIERLLDYLRLAAGSHDAKAVLHVVDTHPRDELFQTDFRDMLRILRGIVNLYERRRVRVFIRHDDFERFYSCFVFVPRDRYNTQVRERIEQLLLRELHGTAVESQVLLSESTLARLHLLIQIRVGTQRAPAEDALETLVAKTIRTWPDELKDALCSRFGAAAGRQLAERYASAFPTAYQADVAPSQAVSDIADLEKIAASPDGMALHLRCDEAGGLRLRVLRRSAPLVLSDVLPLLENLALRVLAEQPYDITPPQSKPLWAQEFELEATAAAIKDIDRADDLFREAFVAVWQGVVENDGFNRLVLQAGLRSRQVNVLRAYCRYLLQTGVPFSQAYMEQTLSRHAHIAAMLFALFEIRFDPHPGRREHASAGKQLQRRIRRALDAVSHPDEDRILRTYLAAIEASIRTNYFQKDIAGDGKSHLSIKFDSAHLAHLPLPKPMFEVFVYSPRVEGVHLRAGYVARGGIRWSDRREDFRTEVLGLMKAQNVKNAVIIPMGAKGGFVPKRLPADASRDDAQREGIECYRTFIRGLLDVTDNIVGSEIVPPANTVRHDGDDAYLVVAADKGTAGFSDVANGIAAEYGFWLGDAFASGGSAGYDHKKLAITARGAWECVRRHFREQGMDVQSQEFTVIGIGDMSGDVFGNGMLRSPHLKLLAAFNHQHIFIDPNPDPATSFKERQRLFALPRSTWEDYDSRLISPGGGVFSRSAKSIRLGKQAQSMLGMSESALAPQLLIQAILRMPVDLLWNGGIGTYVKACGETHAAAGDRANDAVRVNGKELRCKVVGEGGNLGFTQLGRVEYALHGGRLNTDFIDNSGGVDCSDHEVNIKILLARARGLSAARRKRLLADMSEDVAALVLRDNYLQSLAISTAEAVAAKRLPEHAHLIRSLELAGELDRDLERLPDVETITARQQAGIGLTRPELAVLLSYSKLSFYKRLVATPVADDPYLRQELVRYFPPALGRRYAELLPKHRLAREIVATAIANSMVNRMGPSFALRVQEDTGANAATIARAYSIAREVFDMRAVWTQVERLDGGIRAEVQYAILGDSARLLRFATYWLIRHHGAALDIQRQVARLRPGLQALRAVLARLLPAGLRDGYLTLRLELQHDHVPETLAGAVALFPPLHAGLDIVELGLEFRRPVEAVAEAYLQIGEHLSLDWLMQRVMALTAANAWQASARNTLRDQLYALRRESCRRVLSLERRHRHMRSLQRWLRQRSGAVAQLHQILNDLRGLGAADFAALSVALQAVRRLIESD